MLEFNRLLPVHASRGIVSGSKMAEETFSPQELQMRDYIAKLHLDLEDMITQLAVAQPKNPTRYLIEFLSKKAEKEEKKVENEKGVRRNLCCSRYTMMNRTSCLLSFSFCFLARFLSPSRNDPK